MSTFLRHACLSYWSLKVYCCLYVTAQLSSIYRLALASISSACCSFLARTRLGVCQLDLWPGLWAKSLKWSFCPSSVFLCPISAVSLTITARSSSGYHSLPALYSKVTATSLMLTRYSASKLSSTLVRSVKPLCLRCLDLTHARSLAFLDRPSAPMR